MRIHLGSDHAGLELKQRLVSALRERGHVPVDHGPFVADSSDDYPPYCLNTAASVVADPGSLGVVIGGSGNGEQIAANKVCGVRAVLAWSEETAVLGRLHNNANLISIGARMHTVEDAIRFVEVFIETAFKGGQRHLRRIAMLTDYELTHVLPVIADPPTHGHPST